MAHPREARRRVARGGASSSCRATQSSRVAASCDAGASACNGSLCEGGTDPALSLGRASLPVRRAVLVHRLGVWRPCGVSTRLRRRAPCRSGTGRAGGFGSPAAPRARASPDGGDSACADLVAPLSAVLRGRNRGGLRPLERLPRRPDGRRRFGLRVSEATRVHRRATITAGQHDKLLLALVWRQHAPAGGTQCARRRGTDRLGERRCAEQLSATTLSSGLEAPLHWPRGVVAPLVP